MNASPRTTPHARRGTTYVFVLGITLIVTVLGMGALTLSRVTSRSTVDANDWETAGTLAFSATEHALAYLNAAATASPAGWRGGYTSGQVGFTQTVGRGQFSWALKDEIDGNLGDDYLQSFRIYGIGRVGNVTRVYSVQVAPGGSPLDVLRTAVHSSVSVELTGKTMNNYGPISSAGLLKLSGTVYGTIEAGSTSGSASGTQTITAPVAAKTMPSATLFDTLAADATAIDYNSMSGGAIKQTRLTPTYNPYGTANAKGLYLIDVPSGKTLTVTRARVVGTLLVRGAAKDINITGPVLWEPGPTQGPLLFVSSPGTDVKVTGNDTWLQESDAGNLNPAGTPFDGGTDNDATDDYPPQYRGIIHVLVGSSGSLELAANVYVQGTVIADCPIKTTAMSTLLQDSSLYTSPPFGYAKGDALSAVGGDVAVGHAAVGRAAQSLTEAHRLTRLHFRPILKGVAAGAYRRSCTVAVQTIIIADDEPHLTHIVAFNLRKAGLTVHVAVNGAECVKLATASAPDLIVSDFQMPVLDGLSACIQLKADVRTAHVPVIMLTARGHRIMPEELARTNIKALLPKPFSARDLLAKIGEVLATQTKAAA